MLLVKSFQLQSSLKITCKSCLFLRLLCGSHIQRISRSSSSDTIRNTFIRFYENQNGHMHIPSSKVYSPDDRSLLFVNAGMNQFKPIILGNDSGKFQDVHCAVNSQRCIRVGGKHNDLEAVGKDLYHHTFFEMLGSWSFGNYFKEDACKMAWTLLTEVFMLPIENMYVTYFGGSQELNLEADLETKEIWRAIGIAEDRIFPFGLKDNFWEMGDMGPCGPCTEIHFDQLGGRYAPQEINVAGSNVMEIWNLVFMQYNRLNDGTLDLLDKFHVDTGMGLERITAVMQGKKSNYDTDLFQPIINAIEQLSRCHSYTGKVGEADKDGIDAAYRVISDHIRMLTIAIADGIFPGSRGRDLLVRQVLRRAVKAGHEKLKISRMFLGKLVPVVVEKLQHTYPDLVDKQTNITDIINRAEDYYYHVLDNGDNLFDKTVTNLTCNNKYFPLDVAIHLLSYQGYPKDRFFERLQMQDKVVDMQSVDRFFKEKHKFNASKIGVQTDDKELHFSLHQTCTMQKLPKTKKVFEKYATFDYRGTNFKGISAVVLAVVKDNTDSTNSLHVVLDRSCFFHPKGHKLHDVGYMFINNTKGILNGVTAVEGWLVHKVCAEHLHLLPCVEVGDVVHLVPSSNWLALQRAFAASMLLKDIAPTIINDSTIQKVKYDHDSVKYELSGTVSHDTIISLENAVCTHIKDLDINTASTSDTQPSDTDKNISPQNLQDFVTSKVKHQSSGRTIIHFVTGIRALLAVKKLKQLTSAVDTTVKEYEAIVNPSLNEVRPMLKNVGDMTYAINKAEINFDSKANLRNQLNTVSGRLNTMKRRLKRKW